MAPNEAHRHFESGESTRILIILIVSPCKPRRVKRPSRTRILTDGRVNRECYAHSHTLTTTTFPLCKSGNVVVVKPGMLRQKQAGMLWSKNRECKTHKYPGAASQDALQPALSRSTYAPGRRGRPGQCPTRGRRASTRRSCSGCSSAGRCGASRATWCGGGATRRRTTSGCCWRSWRTARRRWRSATPPPSAAATRGGSGRTSGQWP